MFSFVLLHSPHMTLQLRFVAQLVTGEHAEFVGTGWADLTCPCRVLVVHQACAPAQTSCSAYLLSAVLPPFTLVLSSHPILYLIACRERSTHDVTAAAQSVSTASTAFRSATSSQNNVLMARKGSASSEEHSTQEKQSTDVDCSCKKTIQSSRGVRSRNELMGGNVQVLVCHPSLHPHLVLPCVAVFQGGDCANAKHT